jgi:hypothetical protein
VSGSGKSHRASALCRRHGWIHLRSDVERRRLFGRWGTALEPPRQGEAYAPALTTELYGTLLPNAAAAALGAGLTVVVDATFLTRDQRHVFTDLADRLGAPWWILDCSVTLDVARRRLADRQRQGEDPSEADEEVLLGQWQAVEPLTATEKARAVGGIGLEETERTLRDRQPELLDPS